MTRKKGWKFQKVGMMGFTIEFGPQWRRHLGEEQDGKYESGDVELVYRA